MCKSEQVYIIKGYVLKDYIHIFVSAPPQPSVSKLAQLVKGKTSRKPLQEDKLLSKLYYGQHLWARGYSAVSSGTITDKAILLLVAFSLNYKFLNELK